ncbi:MAG: hypothetical protein ABI461_02325, partial [Polyangiaceae bacterium]
MKPANVVARDGGDALARGDAAVGVVSENGTAKCAFGFSGPAVSTSPNLPGAPFAGVFPMPGWRAAKS